MATPLKTPIVKSRGFKVQKSVKGVLTALRDLFKNPRRFVIGTQFAGPVEPWANPKDATRVCALGGIGLFSGRMEYAGHEGSDLCAQAVIQLGAHIPDSGGFGPTSAIADLNNGPNGRKEIIAACDKAIKALRSRKKAVAAA